MQNKRIQELSALNDRGKITRQQVQELIEEVSITRISLKEVLSLWLSGTASSEKPTVVEMATAAIED